MRVYLTRSKKEKKKKLSLHNDFSIFHTSLRIISSLNNYKYIHRNILYNATRYTQTSSSFTHSLKTIKGTQKK